MAMPQVPVFDVELKNWHPSLKPMGSFMSQLEVQEAKYGLITRALKQQSLRERLCLDPELLVYARARHLFCASYWAFVAGEDKRAFSRDLLPLTWPIRDLLSAP
eukprot:CAMPEP_0172624870 /NCGR_PEP_ID=MMETSP1068-20121228/139806_1 /TAXON_ID=35684 /ORGANISM="Pseudopedinella elastica, Strain CCMP716" /LENGTH=103 /DNA_ID=CAMNT_0013433971 /DNA_START=83 /DNA_END=391 /DNA_ORIENTATION=+